MLQHADCIGQALARGRVSEHGRTLRMRGRPADHQLAPRAGSLAASMGRVGRDGGRRRKVVPERVSQLVRALWGPAEILEGP